MKGNKDEHADNTNEEEARCEVVQPLLPGHYANTKDKQSEVKTVGRALGVLFS